MEEIMPKRICGLFDKNGKTHQTGSIWDKDKISPTIDTCRGGYREPLVLEEPVAYDEQNNYLRRDGIVGTLTTDGSSPKHNNRVVEPLVYDGFNQQVRADQTTIGCLTRNIGADLKRNGQGIIEHTTVSKYRVRKLTERECFKLMGVKVEDFSKIRRNQSKSSCYHLAGDSIVSTVLMALFGQMLNIDWKEKVKKLVGEIVDV